MFSHIRKREKLSVEVAKFISIEVACGLQSIHDFGVIYRGIKPENIMLGANVVIGIALLLNYDYYL